MFYKLEYVYSLTRVGLEILHFNQLTKDTENLVYENGFE